VNALYSLRSPDPLCEGHRAALRNAPVVEKRSKICGRPSQKVQASARAALTNARSLVQTRPHPLRMLVYDLHML
jgi:hypothetical protein